MAALADLKATAELYIEWDPNPATRGAIQNMLDEGRTDDLSSVLSKRLKFGTAGLRAKMGPGYNRMNDLVVLQTTQGLALYLEKQFGAAAAHEKGVAIGYDHRANDSLSSKKFGAIASAVLLSRGFKVYLVEKDGFAATPIVAFCTLEKSCAAGIMVTASHNPKEDDDVKCLDASYLMYVLMVEYRNEQASRTASLKVSHTQCSSCIQCRNHF